jgi:hypothetical protein
MPSKLNQNPKLSQYDVQYGLKTLIYSMETFSPVFALSCTHLSNFKTASSWYLEKYHLWEPVGLSVNLLQKSEN